MCTCVPLRRKARIQLQMAAPWDGMGTFVLMPTSVLRRLPACGRKAVERAEIAWRHALMLTVEYKIYHIPPTRGRTVCLEKRERVNTVWRNVYRRAPCNATVVIVCGALGLGDSTFKFSKLVTEGVRYPARCSVHV